MGKARTFYRAMDKLWKSKIIGKATKVKIKDLFNSNVKAVLLYVSESWTITQKMTDMLQAFINKCLRRILNIGLRWPERSADKKICEKPLVLHQIRIRKWNWLGHTLPRNDDSITKHALQSVDTIA